MNDTPILKYAVALSVAAHMLVFLMWKAAPEPAGGPNIIEIDMQNLDVVQTVAKEGVGLQSFTPDTAGEEAAKIAQKKRQAYLRYLEEVAHEIHSRRLKFGRTDLIGIATFEFVIDAQGRFSNVRLVETSGRPELDRIADLAIRDASGKVKRPGLIGTNPIRLTHEVRFQYGLR